jgi:hypothetical protein
VKAAKGTVFIDSGISKLEMREKTYEYYSISHKSSKSLHFQLIQGQRGAQKANPNMEIEEILIADASDILSANFACAMKLDGTLTELKVKYDPVKTSLRISRKGRFSDKLNFHELQTIYYGTDAEDLNLCRESAYQYYIPETFTDEMLA